MPLVWTWYTLYKLNDKSGRNPQSNFTPLSRIFYIRVCVCVCVYTGCPRRNVPDFGRVFLMLKYTDMYPKHLYPKLNGYGDNDQRKVGASCGSIYCNLHSWYVTWQCERPWQWNAVFTVPAWRFAQSAMSRHHWAFSCIVLVTLRTTMTWVRVIL